MGLPVDLPGLDTIIPNLGDFPLVVVEGGGDPAKSFFLRGLVLSALRIGWPVSFIASRDKTELLRLLTVEGGLGPDSFSDLHVQETEAIEELVKSMPAGGLLAVDSFSFLTLDLEPGRLSSMLRHVRAACREKSSTVVLGTDRGMFEPRAEAVALHLADDVVQFHSKEGPEGLMRFLRIPKWTQGKFVDRNIYYEFDGKRLAIDLRRRIL
ncbi:MAG: hypothetical protein L3J95_04675 [Thermoplasmata archaeon]|nr:hypothetical protein [Thermoplasmata archaeon]MCI4359700.1 hypothetical protein [Thermoplasmata archaeon]